LNVTAKLKVLENLKRSWKKKVMEFEELKKERTLVKILICAEMLNRSISRRYVLMVR